MYSLFYPAICCVFFYFNWKLILAYNTDPGAIRKHSSTYSDKAEATCERQGLEHCWRGWTLVQTLSLETLWSGENCPWTLLLVSYKKPHLSHTAAVHFLHCSRSSSLCLSGHNGVCVLIFCSRAHPFNPDYSLEGPTSMFHYILHRGGWDSSERSWPHALAWWQCLSPSEKPYFMWSSLGTTG